MLLLDGETNIAQTIDSLRFASRYPGQVDKRSDSQANEVVRQRVERIIRLEERLSQLVCGAQDVQLLKAHRAANVAGHEKSVVLEDRIMERHRGD